MLSLRDLVQAASRALNMVLEDDLRYVKRSHELAADSSASTVGYGKRGTAPINFAIVDDHAIFRQGVILSLKYWKHTVAFQSASGVEMIETLTSRSASGVAGNSSSMRLPDVIIVDLNMPVMDGFQVIRWLKDNHPDIRILVLTMYEDCLTIVRALYAGANGYLLKSAEATEIHAAISSIMISGVHYSKFATRTLFNDIAEFHHSPPISKEIFSTLPESDMKLIEMICNVKTNQEIAHESGIRAEQVERNLESLYRKLGIISESDILIEKRASNYRLQIMLYAIKYELCHFEFVPASRR